MPGVIQAAVATGTLPFSLSTKFTASRSAQANVNEYHDGTTQRASLVVVGRRSWKLSKRLTAAEIAALYAFWKANPHTAFYFYDPYETLPPFARNPSGDTGRYLVRFASDWDQTTNMVRSDVSVELIQVAGALDIAGALPTTTAGIPVLGTMHAVTAHIPNGAFTPSIGAELSTEGVGLFSPANWIQSSAAWSQRTDTLSFDFLRWSGSVLFGLNTNIGTSGPLSPTDQLWIYDCWCTVTFGDGSIQTLRPTVAAPIIRPQGNVTNPNNAIDGDPSSFAVVERSEYTATSIGTYLALRSFQ